MLAGRGEPFDSAEYLFEVKWNGIRALARNGGGGCRIWGRELADYTGRYPELELVLDRLPAGTIVDGELVLFQSGVPELGAMLARHQLTNSLKVRHAWRTRPVTYVLFDLLRLGDRPLCGQPLQVWRALLEELLLGLQEPRLMLSKGVIGPGRAFFEEAVRQGQEGVMAKHLASRYVPGRRSPSWRKIKPARRLAGVIIGYVPARDAFRSLLVAAPRDGQLRFVACVSYGFSPWIQCRLRTLLKGRVRPEAAVPCPGRAVWVEPNLYCLVQFQEWTSSGQLLHPRFLRLLS
jgi:ATP-dependent DNA ligase